MKNFLAKVLKYIGNALSQIAIVVIAGLLLALAVWFLLTKVMGIAL